LIVLDGDAGAVEYEEKIALRTVVPICSPDGRMLTFRAPGLPSADEHASLFYTSGEAHTVARLAVGDRVQAWVPDDHPPFLDRLGIAGPDTLFAGEPSRLRIEAFDHVGRATSVRSLEILSGPGGVIDWIAADTILAAGPDRTVVQVSGGGRRKAEVLIEVLPAPEPVLRLSENWQRGIDGRLW
jgi:hypothetical protein